MNAFLKGNYIHYSLRLLFKNLCLGSTFVLDSRAGVKYNRDMINNIESVNGVVIGAVTLHVRLFAPNGHEYARTSRCENESEAKEWANETRRTAIANVGTAEAERLGWNRDWEMRIYE